MAERAQIDKGLQHLAGSEEIIDNIIAYCLNAHKANPCAQTMEQIQQYVADTTNDVCGHILTIAHNINSIIDKESKEIEEMSHQVSYVAHRLKSHQTYMSQLYMTKFQTFPLPKHVTHILRQTIPTEKLPKHAKPKKPWIRNQSHCPILDYVGSGKKRKRIQPKATAKAFNPYECMMKQSAPTKQLENHSSAKKASNLNRILQLQLQLQSLYQQEKEAKLKKSAARKVDPEPHSFSAAPPPFCGAARHAAVPPSFSAAPPPSFSYILQ